MLWSQAPNDYVICVHITLVCETSHAVILGHTIYGRVYITANGMNIQVRTNLCCDIQNVNTIQDNLLTYTVPNKPKLSLVTMNCQMLQLSSPLK